ncbi:MAG: glucose-6-phosphate dehydrogenase assembly protein OpcA [Acidobacteria bacterium]|nr:glucose-6-phosphate dehydrogenase assembly protein OpcA [Acidobacteriota bacterium]
MMRASALTILAYLDNRQAESEVSSVVSRVTLQNPCRAIVMIAEPENRPASLEAWVSAHCHVPAGGEKQVCCEQVSVWARGDSVRDLDNVVVPLTLPGLPVFLWWRAGRFTPPDYFQQILRVTDCVLVDSARFAHPANDLASLARTVEQLSGEVVVSDLNWTRTLPWRELAAQCFDSSAHRAFLDHLSRLRIEYEEESPRAVAQGAQALLLAGWLASRLKWEPDKPFGKQRAEGRSWMFKSPQGRVEVEVVPRRFEGGGNGVCFSISMRAESPARATFLLRRGCDGKNAVTRREVQGCPPVERSARLEVFGEDELLNEEIKYPGRDAVYEEALQTVARMTAA